MRCWRATAEIDKPAVAKTVLSGRSGRPSVVEPAAARPERTLAAAGAGGRNGAGSGRPDHRPPERQLGEIESRAIFPIPRHRQ